MPAATATEKIVRYIEARDAGKTQAASAQQAGISLRTAARIESTRQQKGPTMANVQREARIARAAAEGSRDSEVNNRTTTGNVYPRRQRTEADGTVVFEERRPGSKAWTEVKRTAPPEPDVPELTATQVRKIVSKMVAPNRT